MLSGLDTSWVTNTSNGLLSQGHPHWRMVQLETSKLLEMGCVLPATVLPHFQMYRWAFVGGKNDNNPSEIDAVIENEQLHKVSATFVPHVARISRLMNFRYRNSSPETTTTPTASTQFHNNKNYNHIVLTGQSISSLHDLYPFFSTLGDSWTKHSSDNEKDLANCLTEIENVLAADFLEKMPSNVNAR